MGKRAAPCACCCAAWLLGCARALLDCAGALEAEARLAEVVGVEGRDEGRLGLAEVAGDLRRKLWVGGTGGGRARRRDGILRRLLVIRVRYPELRLVGVHPVDVGGAVDFDGVDVGALLRPLVGEELDLVLNLLAVGERLELTVGLISRR